MTTGRKVMVLGLDGMEPYTAKRLVEAGKMPNLKKMIERGAARKDLELLGAMPTITPAQWTTLACGCYPGLHGITDFWNQDPENLDTIIYGLDSRLCRAEQLWNVTAEAGLKTLVWQWPGSAWPPSSDNENLMVVDGTQPASVNYSIANIDMEKYVVASKEYTENSFIDHIGSKNLGDAAADCVIDELDLEEDESQYENFEFNKDNQDEFLLNRYKMKRIKNITMNPIAEDDSGGILAKVPFDRIESTIGEPTKWEKELPEGALEFTIYTAGGAMRRPCLILKNADGVYDTVEVYRTKKDAEPLCVLKNDREIVTDVLDECLDHGKKTMSTRWYKLLELAPDGSTVRMWMSTAFKVDCDDRWSPKSIYKEVIENCGYVPPFSQMGGANLEFSKEISVPCWRLNALWQARAINYLIQERGVEVVFSHHHFIDNSAHQFWNYALQKKNMEPEVEYQKLIDHVYEIADEYIGAYMHLLDEGWTIILTSDHGEQIHDKLLANLGSAGGLSAGIMRELGWTVMQKDENGNDINEIDWSKTKAVAVRTSYIWINLKGRDAHGIVDPEDKYDVEEEIIDSLYRYRDKNGDRVIAMAFHNKDAKVIGLDGPYTGDIIYMNRERHVSEHGQGLSTYRGYYGTSVSPIFVAAGNGIKHDDDMKRTVRQVDIAPTVATLLGVRMPADCEGAPVYQILEDWA